MQNDVLVGYRKVGTGLQTARGGTTGEIMTGAAHGLFYDPASRGSLMTVSNLSTGVAPGTVLSTTPPLALWNPPVSGKNLAIIKISAHYVSGTLGSGIVYSCTIPSQPTVPTTGTELTPICTLVGSPRGVGRAFSGSTFVAIPTLLRAVWTLGPALATSVTYQLVSEIFIDAQVVCMPGTGYALQAIAGAGTSPMMAFSITYEEVDI
jgi:hypothetical protein